MKFYDLKCPNCNANLEVEDDLDIFYCKYCGTKIMLEGRSKDAINAKVQIYSIDKATELRKAEMEHEIEMKKFEDTSDLREYLFLIIPIGVILFLCFLMIFIS